MARRGVGEGSRTTVSRARSRDRPLHELEQRRYTLCVCDSIAWQDCGQQAKLALSPKRNIPLSTGSEAVTESQAMDREHLQGYERLLSQANLSYVRHEEDREEPFNTFLALNVEREELRHSRFIVELLNRRKQDEMPNLEDFLKTVIGENFNKATSHEFQCKGMKVERERYNIDILITSNEKQAIIVENKIDAADQDRQLEGYYRTMKDNGYNDILCVYLTLHDRDTETSRGSLCKNKVTKVSYGDHVFVKWLENCQKQAYEEPALRESIAQYLHLVRKLTGTDQGRKYMNELKKLLLKEINNPVLVHDLSEALNEVKLDLMCELLKDIEKAIEDRHEEFNLPKLQRSNVSRENIKQFIYGTKLYDLGFFFVLAEGLMLFVGFNREHSRSPLVGIWRQDGKNPENIDAISNLENIGDKGERHWPWRWHIEQEFNPRGPMKGEQIKTFKALWCERRRKCLADELAQRLIEVWKKIHRSV